MDYVLKEFKYHEVWQFKEIVQFWEEEALQELPANAKFES